MRRRLYRRMAYFGVEGLVVQSHSLALNKQLRLENRTVKIYNQKKKDFRNKLCATQPCCRTGLRFLLGRKSVTFLHPICLSYNRTVLFVPVTRPANSLNPRAVNDFSDDSIDLGYCSSLNHIRLDRATHSGTHEDIFSFVSGNITFLFYLCIQLRIPKKPNCVILLSPCVLRLSD